MERRKFTREFKLEAVRLIKERGVSYAQASQDLSVHQSQLRGWVKALADDPQHAFPGPGQMKPEQLEIAQLKREVIRLKAERDILKKAAVSSTGQRNGRCQLSRWGCEAKSFSRAGIKLKCDSV
jgi:transposase